MVLRGSGTKETHAATCQPLAAAFLRRLPRWLLRPADLAAARHAADLEPRLCQFGHGPSVGRRKHSKACTVRSSTSASPPPPKAPTSRAERTHVEAPGAAKLQRLAACAAEAARLWKWEPRGASRRARRRLPHRLRLTPAPSRLHQTQPCCCHLSTLPHQSKLPCRRRCSATPVRSTGWGRCARRRRRAWSATRLQVSDCARQA